MLIWGWNTQEQILSEKQLEDHFRARVKLIHKHTIKYIKTERTKAC